MSKTTKNWFEVSREGLAKLLERKGKEFILFELIQNCWDEPGVTSVQVTLEYRGFNTARLTVKDDAPDGFKDFSHAYTLFAESGKKANPEQRGRFNLGEKLVLALAKNLMIESTTGTIIFDGSGRYQSSQKLAAGSLITADMKLTREDCDTIINAAHRLIPPKGITTTINGEVIPALIPEAWFNHPLPTEISDGEGKLRPSERVTSVMLYQPVTGETGWLYEMGIPVCETGDQYHYDVNQKVPLTFDRDNVMPSYLRKIRTAVFNHMADKLDSQTANAPWVADALESKDVTPEAAKHYATAKFGEKRVAYDPSDTESNKIAVSQGFQVVHGGSLSAAAWGHLKAAGAIQPASAVTPSAKVWTGEDNPDAKLYPPIPVENWTTGMHAVADYAQRVARATIGTGLSIRFFNTPHMIAAAAFGHCQLDFNKFRLGGNWFDLDKNREAIDDLLIHELGHHYSGDHLSEDYYRALTGIASRFIQAVRRGELR